MKGSCVSKIGDLWLVSAKGPLIRVVMNVCHPDISTSPGTNWRRISLDFGGRLLNHPSSIRVSMALHMEPPIWPERAEVWLVSFRCYNSWKSHSSVLTTENFFVFFGRPERKCLASKAHHKGEDLALVKNQWPEMSTNTIPTLYNNIVIIEVGFSDINLAYQLQRKLNFTNYIIYNQDYNFEGI